jgi:hypothetical protein
MIIKLLPVKRTGAIGAVAKYIAQDKGHIEDYRNQSVFHNLFHTDLDALTKDFRDNYNDFARKRENGNVAMHVILSVSPLDKDKVTLDKMDDIVRAYVERAYPRALAFGAHHRSQDHWHSHLLVSANELTSSKSTRLSKERLREVQCEMIEYLKEKHPDLTIGIDLKNWGRKLHSERAYYKAKRNPELKLTKDELAERVQGLFRMSESSKDFYRQLEAAGFSTYNYKNRVQGIRFGEDSRKLRFARLGVEHENLLALDKQHERLQDLEAVRSSSRESERDRDQERGLSRDRLPEQGREAGNNSRDNEPDDRDNASDDDEDDR